MTVNVQLSVSETSKPGYIPAKAEKGGSLYYKYTGGTDVKGDVTEHAGKPQGIVVRLEKNDNYGIWSIKFSKDREHQLSVKGQLSDLGVGVTPLWAKGTIIDKDTAKEAGAHFSVVVENRDNGQMFDCDPGVSND